jgi:tripartite ATP-independent transporter DctM subunit
MDGLTTTGMVMGTLMVLIIFRVPIMFAIGAAVCLYFVQNGLPPSNIAIRMSSAIDSSVLVAIPLYLMAAEFMNRSGATDRLLGATMALLSGVRGALAQTNVVSSLIFAGMSGSALADAAGSGKIMIPAMKEKGYDPGYSAAITATTAVVGPVFPPSIPMIVFGAITGTSVGALFLGGILPGLAMTLALMGWTWIQTRRMKLRETVERPSLARIGRAFRDGALPLMTPVLIMSGILFGIMTPTEAGAVAALYACGIGLLVYRTISWRDIFAGISQAMVDTAAVMALLSIAAVLGWIITIEGVANQVSVLLGGEDASFIVVVLFINIVLLLAGMFMDATAAMLVFVPVLAPIAMDVGMSPVQFGVMVVVNLSIGVVTPPVGFCLFVTAAAAQVPVRDVIRATLPLMIPLLLTLAAVSAFPWLTLWLASYI